MLEFETDEQAFPHKNITEAIIGAAFEVYNNLGYSYLHRIYQISLQAELNAGHCRTQLLNLLKAPRFNLGNLNQPRTPQSGVPASDLLNLGRIFVSLWPK